MKNSYDPILKMIVDLSFKIRNNTASLDEKKEYVYTLVRINCFNQEKYMDFLNGKNEDEFLNEALMIGDLIMIGYARIS